MRIDILHVSYCSKCLFMYETFCPYTWPLTFSAMAPFSARYNLLKHMLISPNWLRMVWVLSLVRSYCKKVTVRLKKSEFPSNCMWIPYCHLRQHNCQKAYRCSLSQQRPGIVRVSKNNQLGIGGRFKYWHRAAPVQFTNTQKDTDNLLGRFLNPSVFLCRMCCRYMKASFSLVVG